MKRFATTYSNGYSIETSLPHEAKNFVYADEQQTWFLSGKQVKSAEFFLAAQNACEKALDKKLQTHKQIRVRHGASALSYQTVWVKR